MTKNPTYEEASAELDEILSDIETGDADIDVLSEKVERAAFVQGNVHHHETIRLT